MYFSTTADYAIDSNSKGGESLPWGASNESNGGKHETLRGSFSPPLELAPERSVLIGPRQALRALQAILVPCIPCDGLHGACSEIYLTAAKHRDGLG